MPDGVTLSTPGAAGPQGRLYAEVYYCILQYFGEKKCVFMNRLVNDLLMLIHMIADSSLFMFGRNARI